MKAEFRKLRLQQLNRAVAPFGGIGKNTRPRDGWLSAIRQAQGVTLRELASTLKITPQGLLRLQQSEANETISLKRLRQVAEAMDCTLIYALVPNSGKLTDIAGARNRKNAAERVIAAEHTMALEDQAPGEVEARIKAEQSLP